MIANVNIKGRQTKLLAAIAVLAMVVCALAIAMPASESEAATETKLPSAERGVYTLTESTYGSSAAPIEMTAQKGDISFVLGDGTDDAKASTVYLTFNGTDDGDNLFSTGTLTVDGAITIYISTTGDEGIKTVRALYDMDVTLKNGATVEITSAESIQCQSWWNENSTYGTLILGTKDSTTDVGGHLILNSAGGFSGVKASLYGQSSVEAKNTEVAAMNFAKLDVGEKASVKVQDGTATYINFAGAVTNNGTIDAGASKIDMDKGATLTNTATGKVSAAQITGTVESTDIRNTGEINAKMQLTNDAGEVKYLSGPVSSNDVKLAIGADLEDVTVNPGVTLKINGSATVLGDMRVYGTIAPTNADTGATLTVDGENSITAYNGSSISRGLNVTGTSEKIDISAAMSTITVNDDVDMPFYGTQSQKVVIADTLTIKSGWTMEILGELVINEGCTLIIEDGATLALGNDAGVKASKMTVNGNITVEEGGMINVIGAQDVTVVGEIYSSGTVEINSNVTVQNGGSIIIDDSDNSAINVDGGLTIETGGELSVAGDMKITNISNKGTVTLNGAYITTTSKIQLTGNGAVLDIKSMTQAADANLNVSDEGMFLYTDKDTKQPITISTNDRNFFQFKATGTADVGVRNVKITASVESEVIDKDTTKYYNSLLLSGSITIYDNTDAGDYPGLYTISAKSTDGAGNDFVPSIEVPESLTLGKNVRLLLTEGTMNVDGSMTATADGSKIITRGDIYVNGMITTAIDSPITIEAASPALGINAFHYSDDDYNYYTTLKTSIDNGATDIEYLGNVKVLDTLTIPADTEVKKGSNGAQITIGDEDNRDVIVTVASGATMRNCVIDVMGTLVFDDNKTGNRNEHVYSDVIIDAEPKRTYTNIYTALEDAADNSTVTIARNVYLDKDAEIRETITLEIPAGTGVYLYDEVTLTVNGTVKNSGALGNANGADAANQPIAGVGFNPETEDHAAIIVNGTVMSMTELGYGTYYIDGAYYQLVNDQGAWYYITPVEQAAAVSNDVEKGAIAINGENTVADVTFTGDKGQAVTVTVTADGALAAGTITLDRAGLVVEGDFTGTAASAAGSVKAVNATGFSVIDTYNGETEVTYLTGTPVIDDDEKKESSVTVATGTINAGQIDLKSTGASEFDIAEGATLKVAGQYKVANAEIEATAMTVNGTLIATDKGNVNVTTMTVRGTFTVEVANAETETGAGTATIETLYVGIAVDKKSGEFVDASAAAVTADKINTLKTIYVSGESTVTGKLIENKNTTAFYVEDALWMTIYTTATDMGIETIIPGDLVNSKFMYWADAEGEKIDAASDLDVGDEEAVYANLNYNIYTITVYADPGIQAVYIDGKLMTSGVFRDPVNGMWAEGFQLNVAAGEHEITYKLGNYFSGEAKMTVNGTAVDGNKFTTSGTTAADTSVTVYLQGIEASAPETPSSGDSGMGLTDYLLIILVVLIVIMAIMVAMRLMRS